MFTRLKESIIWRCTKAPNLVFSPGKIQGMIGGHGVGGVCSHIKALGYPIKENSVLKSCWADMP